MLSFYLRVGFATAFGAQRPHIPVVLSVSFRVFSLSSTFPREKSRCDFGLTRIVLFAYIKFSLLSVRFTSLVVFNCVSLFIHQKAIVSSRKSRVTLSYDSVPVSRANRPSVIYLFFSGPRLRLDSLTKNGSVGKVICH